MSLKGASEPGKANKHRSVRYESFPCGNPGTASFPEPEQRQGQHAFPQRPEDTVIFRLPELKMKDNHVLSGIVRCSTRACLKNAFCEMYSEGHDIFHNLSPEGHDIL